jgi:hypothetical protein
MKRLVVLLIAILTLSVCNARVKLAFNPEGKWVSTIPMTDMTPDLVNCSYTFTGDSLYVDVYPSGCGLAAMSIQNYRNTKIGFKCDAVDTMYDIYTGKVIKTKKYKLEFIKHRNTYYVYRDGELVDIIKRFP